MLPAPVLNDLPDLEVRDLGLQSYEDVWEYQKSLQRKLLEGRGTESLILCEHHPVITLGRRGKRENILVNEEELKHQGISIHEVERGGDVTWHGPGQLVCYPILDLGKAPDTKRRNIAYRDVGNYLRALEQTIIVTLQQFEIKGIRIPGKTGVWTVSGENGIEMKPKKIASIGVRISRWCTLHGFSINVSCCKRGFALIHPCGYQSIEVTSFQEEVDIKGKGISEELITPRSTALIKKSLIENFAEVFKYNVFKYEVFESDVVPKEQSSEREVMGQKRAAN